MKSDELFNESVENYIENLSSAAATPGGGNAIGLVNSFACGLMLMSLRIAILKKGGDIEEPLRVERNLRDIQKKSLCLAIEDSRKFKEVLSSWKTGGRRLENALEEAAGVSLEISSQSLRLIQIIESQDIVRFSNIITDVGISLELASTCFKGGLMNYKVNVKNIKDKVKYNRLKKERDKLVKGFNGSYNKLIKEVKGLI